MWREASVSQWQEEEKGVRLYVERDIVIHEGEKTFHWV